MARRTKEEAAATRDSILDAAEKLFVEQGVSRTTLQHIASEAGVTRGAIYWHFDDKSALFNAMMDRVRLPLEAELQVLDESESADPLDDLRNYVMAVLRRTVNDRAGAACVRDRHAESGIRRRDGCRAPAAPAQYQRLDEPRRAARGARRGKGPDRRHGRRAHGGNPPIFRAR